MAKNSRLKLHPKSKMREKGYINVYSDLNAQEIKALFYDRLYKKQNPTWDQTNIILCQKFDGTISNQDKVEVLDAGCGNGNYVIDEYREKIDWAAGVDADTQATRNNICLDEIKYSNLEQIPYPNDEFGVAISLWVAEHLQKPEVVMKELNRVLKKEGKLILVTPNANCWLVILRRIFGNGFLAKLINHRFYGRKEIDVFSTYYRFNTTKSIKSILENSGFKKIKTQFNYEPSYTAFNKLFFVISNLKQRLMGKMWPELMCQHLIVTAEK